MIKLIKLVTAEEIIGQVYREENRMMVVKPCAIAIIPSQSTIEKHAMGLIPYAGYTKGHTVGVELDKIVWMADPALELENQYNMVFNENITIQDTKVIKNM